MSRKAYFCWRGGEVEIDLDCVQSLQLEEDGLWVFMYDQNASFFMEAPPPVTKSVFTQLHNAIHGLNVETKAALKLLNG